MFKKILFLYFCVAMAFLSSCQTDTTTTPTQTAVEWLTIDQLPAKMQAQPRKVIVDLYTDWCGWCKKMDQNTFSDPVIAKYISENFYAVKFNAETKDNVTFNGQQYSYLENGRRGTNQLTFKLILGDIPQGASVGYPTIAFLDENSERINAFPGYRETPAMKTLLRYINENHYSDTDFDTFAQQNP